MKFIRSNKKQTNKHVSFGDDTVMQIESIPPKEQALVWYNHREIDVMQRNALTEGTKGGKGMALSKGTTLANFLNNKVEPSEEELSHLYAQKLVKKIANTCRIRLEHSDGYWDPKIDKELSKVSLAGSKNHRDAATKRARTVYKEVYGGEVVQKASGSLKSGGTSKFLSERVRSLAPFAKSSGNKWASAPIKKPNLERQETESTLGVSELSISSISTSGDQLNSSVMLRTANPRASLRTQGITQKLVRSKGDPGLGASSQPAAVRGLSADC